MRWDCGSKRNLEECCGEQKFSYMRQSKVTTLSLHHRQFLSSFCIYLENYELFRNSKVDFFLRTSASWRFPFFFTSFDIEIRHCLENILNIELDDKQRIQATLSINRGVRGIEDINVPVFLASKELSSTVYILIQQETTLVVLLYKHLNPNLKPTVHIPRKELKISVRK